MDRRSTSGVFRSNPLISAGFLSKVFVCWLTPFMRQGYRRRLEKSDMYRLLPEDGSEMLGVELQRLWDHEVRRSTKDRASLSHVITRCYGRSYVTAGLFVFSVEAIKVVQPLLLGRIISYFEDDDDQSLLVYVYAAAMSFSTFALSILQHLYYYHAQRLGMKIRVALGHMIYKKALTLSSEVTTQTSTGHVVNLVSNDIARFDEMTLNLWYLLIGPLQAVVILSLLWVEVGVACLAGVAVLLLLMPTQTYFGKLFGLYRAKCAVLTDSRIRMMNEVVSGIRTIKMYAWEKVFCALVSEVRRKEISQVMRTSYLRGLNMASFFSSSKVIVFVTFMVYVLLGHALSARRVFVTVSLYGTIKITVTLFFPLAVEKLSETLVSISRVQDFLLLEEVHKPHVEEKQEENRVEVEDMTCYWDKMAALQNISFTAPPHQLLAVIGPVGSGKSSLLSAILGEVPCDTGSVRVKGRLRYCSQQPWLFTGSVRSNILFGREMDRTRYDDVITACALKRDLELLPDGDLTQIGDRGATLSGGQKARINLARAVYEEADVYLLDDPLSAVDPEVGNHLFEQCVCRLLKNTCRILVTHQLQHLRSVDHILVLKEGQITAQGSYTDLLTSELDMVTLLKREENQDQHQNQNQDLWSPSDQEVLSDKTDALGPLLPVQDDVMTTIPEEACAEGNVKRHIYYRYFTAGSSLLGLGLILLLSLIAEVAYILQDWWLVYWAKETSSNMTEAAVNIGNRTNSPPSDEKHNVEFYLSVYSGLTGAAVVFSFSRSLVIFHVLVRCSQTLHDHMFKAVVQTPVRFYDLNPVGRILNRFSKDISHMDSTLPLTFMDFYQLFLQNVGVVVVATWVLPLIVVPVVPLLMFFLYLRRFYLRTSRHIKRLESTSRSPVFSHLSSSLQGLWTIRAFRAQQRLQRTYDDHQDLHSAAWFLFIMTSRWFALRLDIICSVFITITAFGCILLRQGLDPGEVGLVLTYAVTLVGNFQWTVRQSAEVENMMTSVERVVEYTDLESEALWVTNKRPPANWPSKGSITFSHVNFSYSPDGPLVLRDISISLEPSEKVGVVGRTGAGKSSLISALLRLGEPEGEIFIDGVLTSEIGLHDLREKISIIPQDPVLFSDSVRKNLDPFSQHSDDCVWTVLEEVQMKAVVEELPLKLGTVISECGSNFSVGQRQLLCLGRALLRKNLIVIIDEATANVDPRTDELIQRTIREKFRECTVITIAHRINTIIDSERIMVLDGGSIVEMDRPITLLQNKHSVLYHMVQQLLPPEHSSPGCTG